MDRTQSTSHRERSVFITVGSTRFDSLVTAASSPDFVALLHSLGYSHLSIQHGRSPLASYFVNAQALADRPIATSAFDYKSSLTEDLMHADLVISHGGSGTILEALRLKKNLVVVVNEELMDNHQQELDTQRSQSPSGENNRIGRQDLVAISALVCKQRHNHRVSWGGRQAIRAMQYAEAHKSTFLQHQSSVYEDPRVPTEQSQDQINPRFNCTTMSQGKPQPRRSHLEKRPKRH
ncbi:hypothetical protein BGW38_000847 [Lunasporangiospora selenospora]|uniref:UDP-N-acetylglucosamine transferase subunit ALG13 n=1 Tax=Lunasporangiospora selenospora TaxID=979761 RepID=A0A9P6KIA1_9FUNG|nr:hypothetical protein BGW38_000847 [Lunasporangiospora selenospora]